ncbi:MAG: hypothetical protein ACJAYJ_004065 [Saprospiraceae bacterium]|jgi:hypothetical protein
MSYFFEIDKKYCQCKGISKREMQLFKGCYPLVKHLLSEKIGEKFGLFLQYPHR